jgi:hypothetical protein
VTAVAFYPQKAEGDALAVVRHPHRGLQNPQQSVVIGPRRHKLSAWHRAPRIKDLQHSGWKI